MGHYLHLLLEEGMHAQIQRARIIALAHIFDQRLRLSEQILIILRKVIVLTIVEHHLHASQETFANNHGMRSEISTLKRLYHIRPFFLLFPVLLGNIGLPVKYPS